MDLLVGHLGWEFIEGARDGVCLLRGDLPGGEGVGGGGEPAGR